MIVYNPLDGDVLTGPIACRAQTCFLMTALGVPAGPEIREMRRRIEAIARDYGFASIDADAAVTGRDFLIKIWRLIAETPVSVGIVGREMGYGTRQNVFYELGVAQAMGKETVVVKSPDVEVPSDLVRTEYVMFDAGFEERFSRFMEGLEDIADHYETVADQVERNPILALDYFRRAYLLNAIKRIADKAADVLHGAGIEERARNSVEVQLADLS